jgi:tRNA pseudouridine32 synthase / 23S rRNA pseudouridine746 synthase
MKSRLHLPKLEPAPGTILEYLVAHFPHIPAQTWLERINNGKIELDDGSVLTAESPYRHGATVLYSREVAMEPESDETVEILYQGADILVADKPRGIVVTPSGEHVERSLLAILQKRTGLPQLAPVHRLDRETAGVVLFTVHESRRGQYHLLFSNRKVEREYLAVARLNDSKDTKEWCIQNRMEEGEPWYRRRIVEGSGDGSGADSNAITRIVLLESRDGLGLFKLLPETGKKHQLRVHMASIGCPIVGDRLYPDIRTEDEAGPPLQLLAHRLSFVDPLSGEPRSFTTKQRLLWPAE